MTRHTGGADMTTPGGHAAPRARRAFAARGGARVARAADGSGRVRCLVRDISGWPERSVVGRRIPTEAEIARLNRTRVDCARSRCLRTNARSRSQRRVFDCLFVLDPLYDTGDLLYAAWHDRPFVTSTRGTSRSTPDAWRSSRRCLAMERRCWRRITYRRLGSADRAGGACGPTRMRTRGRRGRSAGAGAAVLGGSVGSRRMHKRCGHCRIP